MSKKRQRNTTLYHFTCEHGYRDITASRLLLPNIQPFMRELGPLLWLSDLSDPPNRESLGLTANLVTCDRMAYRYTVRTHAAVHWYTLRARAPAEVIEAMEAFGMPQHWWVARRPLVPSEFHLDPTWNRSEAAPTPSIRTSSATGKQV